MTESLIELATTSAAAAWLTKTSVDQIRRKIPLLSDINILVLAGVLALIFNVGWVVAQGKTSFVASDVATIFLQSVLSFLGAWGATEGQKAAKSAEKEAKGEPGTSG